MQFVTDLGPVALGSQLKAVSDRLYAMADEVYRRSGSGLEARWFPVLKLLHDRGGMTVGDIAKSVGQTHSAISQLTARLQREGWIVAVADPDDRRVRRVALSEQAELALRAVKPVWRAFAEVLAARSQEAGIDSAAIMDGLSRMLDGPLVEEIVARARDLQAEGVTIVPFHPDLRDDFYRLNAEWLERYFYIEAGDHAVLSDPEGAILAQGGQIFFARSGGDVVGTCALLPVGEGEVELTKMGVAPSARGLGVGRKLLEHAIRAFEEAGARTLFLETNTKLVTAIRMYESAGFEHQPARRGNSHYERANVYMIWRGWPKSA